MSKFEYGDLLGQFVLKGIGPDAREVYRQNIVEAIKGDCDSSLHNSLANVQAGVSDFYLDDNGYLPDESLEQLLGSMHHARLTPAYSDDWYWRHVLGLAFDGENCAQHAEKARRLYVMGSGMSDRLAYTEDMQDFCHNVAEFRFRHHDARNVLRYAWTPVSIRLYEKAGVEPHLAVIPAKRGGQASFFVSDAFRTEWARWQEHQAMLRSGPRRVNMMDYR
jgi:hypothetical protein